MSPVSGRKPFTELYETVQNELIREAATGEESKYKGGINQVYLNELPALLPERYIRKDAFVATVAEYTTGTVTVGTGTDIAKGASTSWTSASSNDFLINVSGADEIYRVTFSADTLLTSKDSLTWTESTGSGLSYTLFQDRYQLASDFNYMVKDSPNNPNVVFRYINGVKAFMDPWTNEEYDRQFTTNIGSIHSYTVKFVTDGNRYIYVQSNPTATEHIGYSYIPVITQLRELTTGTATLTTGTSLVLTSDATITASLDTARTLYFRADDDGTGSGSLWNKISTVTNDSVATLSGAYTGTASGVGVTYTISEISQWPERFDDVLMYKAAWIYDPDGVQSEKWLALSNDAVGLELATESKRNRQDRLRSFPGTRDTGRTRGVPGARY